MSVATELYSAEDAVALLAQLGAGRLIRGKTASPGNRDFDRAVSLGAVFRRCDCGREKKGWTYPEFVAMDESKVLTIGGDAKSRKISCGYKGYHSDEYGGDFNCPSLV